MDSLMAMLGFVVALELVNVIILVGIVLAILHHTQHVVDATIALKLSSSNPIAFGEAMQTLRNEGVVPDVPDVDAESIEVPRVVSIKSPDGPAEQVELVHGFDDPRIVTGG